ncbi:helix-turn-helix transcriptional regulator [Mucilaginibacter rubeus]|nr:helix-turn-helix transcriptional regulator [Mucilaginibacter rubeus]QEM20842.1 helix-turn-helix transcriptional regulator [Mucilaginibacter gossypii]
MHRSMAILGTKWKPILIWALRDRKARFGQIAAAVGLISRKVLTTTLKELEEDGVVMREEFKELPPRVEYSLTEKGLALIPVMLQLVDWDRKYFATHSGPKLGSNQLF